MLTYDVIDAELPLLLGKDTMKKAETEINLHKDKVTMLGCEQPLSYTASGHYTVALSPQVLTIESNKPIKVLLSISNLADQSETEKEKSERYFEERL